jgi:GDP-L-fucose synthase
MPINRINFVLDVLIYLTMNKDDKILILGSRGMVGSAIHRNLIKQNYKNILSPPSKELNLLDQKATLDYFSEYKPNHIINAAARVGGIMANDKYGADFIFQNLSIQNNTFQAAFENDVDTYLFLGSSCIYPKYAKQPMVEDSLLTSELEPTSEAYAIAKIAGLKTAQYFKKQYGQNYFTVMPSSAYGEGDNFNPADCHVLPGLINRMSEAIKTKAPKFEIWGTGKPQRELLYVDDLAEACIFLLNYKGELPFWINIGTGTDITIKKLAQTIAKEMGYEGELYFNTEYPDGVPRKLLDVSKINGLGWSSKIDLQDGISKTIKYFKDLNL